MAQREMLEWWGRNEDLDLRGYTKAETEDLTGRVPLFLTSILGDEKKIDLNAPKLIEVGLQAQRFVDRVRDELRKKPDSWAR